MTTLTIERLDRPEQPRIRRLRDEWANDELAGRTVWCVGAGPTGGLWVETLDDWLAGTVAAEAPLAHPPDPGEALRDLGEQIDALLFAPGGTAHDLRSGDIVVAHDLLAARLAPAGRDRGAHVVWRIDADAPTPRPSAVPPVPVDAYLTARPAGPGRAAAVRVVAAMPHADVLSAREVPARAPWRTAWNAVLAQIVHSDRAESVGGRRGPRPYVAIR